MLTTDSQGIHCTHNHAWLFGWRNGHMSQASPSKAMRWRSTIPGGYYDSAGLRADGSIAIYDIATMYDACRGEYPNRWKLT